MLAVTSLLYMVCALFEDDCLQSSVYTYTVHTFHMENTDYQYDKFTTIILDVWRYNATPRNRNVRFSSDQSGDQLLRFIVRYDIWLQIHMFTANGCLACNIKMLQKQGFWYVMVWNICFMAFSTK